MQGGETMERLKLDIHVTGLEDLQTLKIAAIKQMEALEKTFEDIQWILSQVQVNVMEESNQDR